MGRRKKGRYESRVCIYKKTDDDWSCNFEGNLVQLSYHKSRPEHNPVPRKYAVSVWGDDDIGMYITFENKTDAIRFFERVEAMPVLNQKDLLTIGFNWA